MLLKRSNILIENYNNIYLPLLDLIHESKLLNHFKSYLSLKISQTCTISISSGRKREYTVCLSIIYLDADNQLLFLFNISHELSLYRFCKCTVRQISVPYRNLVNSFSPRCKCQRRVGHEDKISTG